mgnify:CR=1 FL=1
MFGNRARYDWLVDGQPTCLSFTEAGDVACSIEVSMEFEGACLAFVDEPVSVALADIAASGAFLARISGIDVDDGLALPFGLVFDEPLKLAEGPISELPVEASPEPLLSTNSELLQCYSIERLGQYPVSYLVVDIDHEAFFPSRELLELSLGGAGAFGLKPPTEILVLPFDLSNVRRSVKIVIGEDGMVDYACIDTDDGIWWPDRRRSFLDHDAENEFTASIGELGRNDLPTQIFPEIIWDLNWDVDSLVSTCEGHESLSEFRRECPLIVSDGRPFSFGGQSLEFFPFQHFGSIVPGSCNDGRGDVRIFFSEGVVCEMVELELIDDPILEARLEDIIGSEIGHFDGLDQSVIGFDMQSDCPLHAIESLAPSIDTYMGGDRKLLQFLPALKNGVSLEAIDEH